VPFTTVHTGKYRTN